MYHTSLLNHVIIKLDPLLTLSCRKTFPFFFAAKFAHSSKTVSKNMLVQYCTTYQKSHRKFFNKALFLAKPPDMYISANRFSCLSNNTKYTYEMCTQYTENLYTPNTYSLWQATTATHFSVFQQTSLYNNAMHRRYTQNTCSA